MEWTDGIKLNDYITQIINNNSALEQLQSKLIELNGSLENEGLAHGDIQSGNLFIEIYKKDINLKGLYLLDFLELFPFRFRQTGFYRNT